jgi:hypothetical protein
MKHVVFLPLTTVPLLLGGCVLEGAHEAAVMSAEARQLVCLDGVEYVALPIRDSWSVAPHYKPDGTLFTCSDPAPPKRRPILVSPR